MTSEHRGDTSGRSLSDAHAGSRRLSLNPPSLQKLPDWMLRHTPFWALNYSIQAQAPFSHHYSGYFGDVRIQLPFSVTEEMRIDKYHFERNGNLITYELDEPVTLEPGKMYYFNGHTICRWDDSVTQQAWEEYFRMALPAKRAKDLNFIGEDPDDDYDLGRRSAPVMTDSVEATAAAEFLDGLGREERERIGRESAAKLKAVLDNLERVDVKGILYFDRLDKSGKTWRYVILRTGEQSWVTTVVNPRSFSSTDLLIVWLVSMGVPHISPLYLAQHGQRGQETLAKLP